MSILLKYLHNFDCNQVKFKDQNTKYYNMINKNVNENQLQSSM